MTTPGFGGEASLYGTALSYGVAGASEQPASAVYPAQAWLRHEALLSGDWRRNLVPYVRPNCQQGTVPRWVRPCTQICLDPNDFSTCSPPICLEQGHWECQAPTFTALG